MVTAAAARSTIQGGGGAGATNNNNISKLPPAANAQEEGGKYYIHGQNRILRCKFTGFSSFSVCSENKFISSLILFWYFVGGYVIVTSYNNLLEMRYSQLVEEQEHKFSTATNQKELLTQTLHRLRLLKDEIARDDWMFEGFGK